MHEKVDVYLPLFVGDYLADTTELIAEEHGAYLLLLMSLWRREGRLPTDPARLAFIARLDFARWESVWSAISRFFELEGDCYIQKRLTREIDRAKARKAAAFENGRKGGLAKAKQTPSEVPSQPPSETVAVSSSSSSSSSEEIRSDPPLPPKGDCLGSCVAPEAFPRRKRKRKGEPVSYEPNFLRLYERYPRKDAKSLALEAWIAVGRPVLEIESRWIWQLADYQKRERDKVPMFATYLNQRRWEDSPPNARVLPISQSRPNADTASICVWHMYKREHQRDTCTPKCRWFEVEATADNRGAAHV